MRFARFGLLVLCTLLLKTPMWAQVQSNAIQGSAVGSVSVAFPTNNTAGNLIIAFVRMSTTTQTVTVTDTLGNSYTDAVTQGQTADGHQTHIFYAKNILAGANTVKATFSASNNHPWLAIYEYSGLSTTSPLDQTAHAQGSSAAPSSGATATTNSSNELVFAGIGLPSSYTGTATAGTGYTMLQQDTSTSPGDNEAQSVTSTGAYAGTFSTSLSTNWSAVVATFRVNPPTISDVSPNTGGAGLYMNVNGAHFGSSQGTSTVTFNNVTATNISVWSDTRVTLYLPSGVPLGPGPVIVKVGGVASNSVTFTEITTPFISSVPYNSGPVGSNFTVNGSGFGATQGTSTLTINGTPVTQYHYWNDNQIGAAIVPPGATTGYVVVTVNGSSSPTNQYVIYTVAPNIASISPASGPVGDSVTINGLNFGATQGSSTVTFYGSTTAAAITSWSSTQIVATVPPGATSGNVVVNVGSLSSVGFPFTVAPPPNISGISPNSGGTGQYVTISGSNFGSTMNVSTVKFNGVLAAPTSWNDTTITTTVPAGATTGNVVINLGSAASNGYAFTVNTSPFISSLSPNIGPVGQQVTIYGSNFGSSQGASTVTFNGTAATPVTWSATSIVVPVPLGATTGNVVVTVSGVASNGVVFTVSWLNSYAYRRTITIDHTKVPNTDQINFPVLISGTYSYLATTSNGGNVTSTNGYDIIFTSDVAGTNVLSFEQQSYNASTGAVNYWVNVPTVSHTADTVLYMFYGNSLIATDQSNRTGVWGSSYKGVWHLANGNSAVMDSTSNGNDGANNGATATTGKFSGAVNFNGTNEYIDFGTSSTLQPTGAMSASAWIKAGSSQTTFPQIVTDGDSSGVNGYNLYLSGNHASFILGVSSWGACSATGTTLLNDNAWHYVTGTYAGAAGAVKIYVDGALQGTTTCPNSGTVYMDGYHGFATGEIGWKMDHGANDDFSGALDEVRVLTGSLTGDWITTEYNNQNSPSTFYSVGSASSGGGTTTFGSWAYHSAITIDHTKVPNTDQTSFPVLISGAYPFLATTSNGGNVTNPNGYDIIFTSDAAGANTLPFEQESYNASTGAVSYWVNLPTVSHSADTVFYIFYGNSLVTTDLSNKTGVWSSNYDGVWHFGNGGSSFLTDSTSNGNEGANNAVGPTTGKIGGAVNLNGGAEYIDLGTSATLQPSGAMSATAWIKNVTNVQYPQIISDSDSTGLYGYGLYLYNSNHAAFTLNVGGSFNNCFAQGTTNVNDNTWHYVAGTYAGGGGAVKIYVDGALQTTSTCPNQATNYGTSPAGEIGWKLDHGTNDSFVGGIDEARVLSSALSADWIATEYNNQNSPSTFYSFGAAIANPVISSLSPTTGGVGQRVTIGGLNFGSAQGFVTFNGLRVTTILSWTSTQISVLVPSGASTGSVVVTAGGVTSNKALFTVITTPYISSLSPNSGSTGQSIVISGSNFGAGPAPGSTVTFSGTTAAPTSWSNTSIVVAVPAGAASGYVVVTVSGTPSNGSLFIVQSGSSTWQNGYSYRRAITIDHTKIHNTDQSGFPMLFSGTYPYLASYNSGGNVTNANGFDIIFTSDPAGVNILPFEQETYTASSGAVTYWVQVPKLSHASDTVIYMFYGNPSVTTDQSNKAGVWSVYSVVWHLPNGTNLTANDSTSGGNNGTITGATPTTGMFGGGASFNGSGQISLNGNSTAAKYWTYTIDEWVKPANLNNSLGLFGSRSPVDFSFGAVLTGSGVHGNIGNGSSWTTTTADGSFSYSANTWHHVVYTVDTLNSQGAGGYNIYVDGSKIASGSFTGYVSPILYDPNHLLTVGATGHSGEGFYGSIDEVRIADALSADWIAAEYQNESSPATFYGVGAANAPTITSLSPTTGAVNTTITITGTNFGPTQGSSTVIFNNGATAPTATTWTPTSIVVSVPSGAQSGYVVVNVGGTSSNGYWFTVPSAWSSPYAHRSVITIDHTKVPNTDQLNFPVLISGTYPYLAGINSGGDVTSANGYDIVFTSDSAGTSLLSFEQESYNASTGAVSYWVKLPTVSHTTDTVFYMFYGNPSVTTDQSAKTAVWDSSYIGVWHLNQDPSGTAPQMLDSTANANHGTAQGAWARGQQVNGEIGGSLGFDSVSGDYISTTNSVVNPASETVQVWFKAVIDGYKIIGFESSQTGTSSTSYDRQIWLDSHTGQVLGGFQTCTYPGQLASGGYYYDGQWHQAALTVDTSAQQAKLYVDGVQVGNTIACSAPQNYTGYFRIGSYKLNNWTNGLDGYFQGGIDEARVSLTARSADWIATEYRNQSSPSTFYTIWQVNPPVITSLSATSAAPGKTVTITGTSFGAILGSVYFNGLAASVSSWSETSIVTTVPANATSGNVTVLAAGQSSNGVAFTVLTAPAISSITPATGGASQAVTIIGSNFGASQGAGAGTVKFGPGSTTAPVTNWSNTQIQATVPSGAQTGNVIVTVAGVASNGVTFTVITAPYISGLTPGSGGIGCTVVITGSDFGTTQGTVTFGPGLTPATITNWTNTQIQTSVPGGASTGNVVVTAGGVASNGVPFTVGPSIYYYFTDALGSSRVITDANGTVCYDADFYPFGGERAYTTNCTQNYKFTGKERDSGLDNFGARYDSSQYGRFMSPDPLGGSLSDPQTLNKYSYVRNNPVTLTDPTGMNACDPNDAICTGDWGFGVGFDGVRGCGGDWGPGSGGSSSSSAGSSGNCAASMSTCDGSGNGGAGDYNTNAYLASGPFELQWSGTVCLPDCRYTVAIFDNWGGYANWSTNIAAQGNSLQNIVNGFGPQLAWAVDGLIQQGATDSEIGKFLSANKNPFSTKLGAVILISRTLGLVLPANMTGVTMDSTLATMTEPSTVTQRIRLIFPAAHCCILGWILFLATLLMLSLASQAAAQGGSASSSGPIWRLDVQMLGYTPPQKGLDNQEIGSLLGIEPMCFLDRDVVVVSFVTREAPVALPRRSQPGGLLPFRLHAVFIDSKTGRMQARREWPAASVRSRVLAVPGGKFVVLTPDQLLLYSVDFDLLNKLDVPLGESVKNDWDATQSPGGKYLLLSYESETEEKRLAGSPLSVYIARLDTMEIHLIWIDLENLQTVERWTTTERSSGGFMWPRVISDAGVVQITKRSNDGDIVDIGRPPNGPWHPMCSPSDSFCGPGQFVGNDRVLRTRLSGQDKNVQLWIGLLNTSGELLFQQTFPKGEAPREPSLLNLEKGISVSSNGQRFALGMVKMKGGNVFFDIGGHASMERIMVYDVPSNQWAYTLDAKTQNIKAVSGMALSPDGSLLGIINQDGVLEVFRIPEIPTHQ